MYSQIHRLPKSQFSNDRYIYNGNKMSRFSDINKILSEEPEEWLAYLHGQQFSNLPHLKEATPKISGVILRIAVYFYHLIYSYCISAFNFDKAVGNIDFFVYAGSANQANSLNETINNLSFKSVCVLAQSPRSGLLNKINKETNFEQLKFSLSDVCTAIVLFIYHGRSLYLRLKAIDQKLIDNYFNVFCSTYLYLAVFYRVMKTKKPSFVIMSNDHNPDCRSLLAVAHFLNIKTVYMQHASVSDLFPALTVDYAFLDGQCALDTYLECEAHKSKFYQGKEATEIFLTGQKKILSNNKKKENNRVGLAVNMLDEVNKALSLVDDLTKDGFHICIRWHPRQIESEVRQIKNALSSRVLVTLSDPKKQSIDSFLSEVSFMISGNSSIHLEAAAAGVITVYYELQPTPHPDYYGYVRNGVAIKVNSYSELKKTLVYKTKPNHYEEAVRYYSATYGTEWYGKEGELVAKKLLNISNIDR